MIASGCGAAQSIYFPSDPATQVRLPVVSGDAAYVGIQLLSVTAGDVVILDGVEALGLTPGAHIVPLVADVVNEKQLIGIGTKEDIEAGGTDLTLYEPLPREISGRSGPYQLVVVLTGSGVYGFDSMRLLFHLNGQADLIQEFALSAHV